MNEKENKFLYLYNSISDKQISYQKFNSILPKLSLVLKHIPLDIIEIIDLIDALIEFQKVNQLDKINEETIDIIKKIVKNKFYNLDGTLYFSMIIKHVLLPFNLNNCEKTYEQILHISTFETLLEIIIKVFNNNDYYVLQTYNYELSELVLQYKKNQEIYKKNINKEIVLSTIISHIYAIFYFNYVKYNGDYHILDLIVNNSINNYQQFINYCYYEGINNNFTKTFLDSDELKKEYMVSQKMVDYTFNNLDKIELKRKCY